MTSNHQRVVKTTPQTAHPSGLMLGKGPIFWKKYIIVKTSHSFVYQVGFSLIYNKVVIFASHYYTNIDWLDME